MPDPAKHAYTDDEFDDPLFGTHGSHALAPDLDSTREDRTAALIAHLSPLVGLGIVAPLVIYLLKRDESPFVADQAKEALNFHITALIAFVASAVLVVVLVGFVLLIGVAIAVTIFSIIAAIRANEGEVYRYPFTLRLV